MAIYRKVTKCKERHPLLVRYGYFSGRFCNGDFFCKICGYIDRTELMTWVDKRIRYLRSQRVA